MSSRKVLMKTVTVTVEDKSDEQIARENILRELHSELQITAGMVEHINRTLELRLRQIRHRIAELERQQMEEN